MSALLRAALSLAILALSACSVGGAGSPPPLGTAVFGSHGLVGSVTGTSAGTAIVNPVGGGAPGMLVPNGNGTATLFRSGGAPPAVIPAPPR